MKKVTIILFIISSSCLAQFKLNYSDIQNKYGLENVEKYTETFEQNKILKDSILGNFNFTKKDSLLVHIFLKKNSGISENQFKNFVDEYFEVFNADKIERYENTLFYYDEKRKILIAKVFESSSSNKLTEIWLTIDKKTIDGFLPVFEPGH